MAKVEQETAGSNPLQDYLRLRDYLRQMVKLDPDAPAKARRLAEESEISQPPKETKWMAMIASFLESEAALEAAEAAWAERAHRLADH
jgi:hypothetical protein